MSIEEQDMSEQYNGNGRDEQRTRTFNPQDHLMQLRSKDGSKDYLPVQWRLVWFREMCPHGTIDTEELAVDLDREMEEEAYVWNNETRRSEKVVKKARGYARYKAIVTDGKGGRATGTKSEKAVSFPDYIEKAETGAIGRALAALGYGTQFTGDEFDERHRIVDAPVTRLGNESAASSNGQAARNEVPADHTAPAQPTSPEGNGSNGRKPLAAMKSANATKANGKVAENVRSTTATGEKESETLATEQQLASIRKLCQHLGKPEPENQETMTYLSAKELIAQLSLEYRQSRSKAS
jgi:hypothetical protein